MHSPNTQEVVKSGESEVQCHSLLPHEFKDNLGYLKHCLKKNREREGGRKKVGVGEKYAPFQIKSRLLKIGANVTT